MKLCRRFAETFEPEVLREIILDHDAGVKRIVKDEKGRTPIRSGPAWLRWALDGGYEMRGTESADACDKAGKKKRGVCRGAGRSYLEGLRGAAGGEAQRARARGRGGARRSAETSL